MKICKHFGECGGCRFQDLSYKKQLKSKQEKVKNFVSASGFSTKIRPIQYAHPWEYRNKMEFTFSGEGKVSCGLYSRKIKRKLIDIEECLIFSSDAGKILKAVKDFANRQGYLAYDKYSHKGFLRNLICRQTKFTKQTMIGLVTASSDNFNKVEFVQKLKSLKLKAKLRSIYWIINDSFSDAVVFENKELLWGKDFIQEKLGGFLFQIGIDTFSQVNPKLANRFYKKIRKYAKLSKRNSVLDLFCGSGSIGIFLAKKAKFIWGVELAPEVVSLAWENSRINKINNISFFASDVKKFLNSQGIFYKNIDLLIVNPPRSGLSNKVLRAILRLRPKTLIYSSCNPEALFRDLESLTEKYAFEFVEPFDFFPHTPHLEVLTLLRKK